jgi:hypothetical protein
MTITRAAYYLHNVGLCKIEGTKDKFLHFDLPKKELWERAEPLMSSPVKQFKYYSGSVFPEVFKGFLHSNISALSHYSDINPEPVEYYAAKTRYTDFTLGDHLKYSGQLEGNICIEEWKYDPSMLSIDGNVDPLSLYLCFREDKNERIEMALEQLIESVKW